jgi:hypothetical protein
MNATSSRTLMSSRATRTDGLGIHQARAAQWVRAAGATYSGYVELRLARDVDVP